MKDRFIIEVSNLTKRFPGVKALDGVNLKIREGSVHCIMGENGAGKSTLVRILTGLYRFDEGEILIDGRNVARDQSVHELIAYVPQEIDLFPNLTVAENLFMPFSRSGMKGFFISKSAMVQQAERSLKNFCISVSPHEIVRHISIANQQLLQIARAETQTGYKVLIMDEPTTSLTELETEVLFETVRQLQNKGKTIIFISHKLEEMFTIGNHVSVLRNGCLVGEQPVDKVNSGWVVDKMSGEEIDTEEIFRPTVPIGEVVLKVRNLTGSRFKDVSFDIREGEVLGFAGLIGAGRSELMQSILGYLKYDSGTIELGEQKYKASPPRAMRSGIVYLPEERKQQGIFPSHSVQNNLGISLFNATSKLRFISRKKEKKIAQQIVDNLEVKMRGLGQPIMYLSGGNQQKVIIGRAIFGGPKLIIFDEPTKGIDIKAKAEIHRNMKRLAEEERIAIVLVSSELDEILKCTNRIIALYMGKKVAEYITEKIDRTEIMREIIGATQ